MVTKREQDNDQTATPNKLLTFLFECCQWCDDIAHRPFQVGEEFIVDEFEAFNKSTVTYKVCAAHH